jgi:ABC-type multidrug transport system fused ATPase/permease subunit
MSVSTSVKASLALLSARDQLRIKLVVLLQFGISFLDLLGVLILGLITALATVATTGTPLPDSGVGSFVNSLPNSSSFVIGLALTAGIVLVSKSILGLIVTRRTFKFLANRQAIVAGNLAHRLLSRPLLEVQSRSSQETTLALTNGVTALTLNTLGPVVVVAAEMSLVFVLALGLILVDPLVALFSVGFFALLIVLLQYLLGSWATRLGRGQTNADIGSFAALQHALRTYREISVSGRRGLFINRFQSLRWNAARVLADQFILSQVGKYVFEVGLIIGGGLLVLLISLTRDTAAAIAIITVFLASSARLIPSLLRLQGGLMTIRGAQGTGAVTLALIDELNAAEAASAPPAVAAPIAEAFNESIHAGFPGFIPSVSLQSVELSYPEATELALDSITLEITPGESVALVGATGAGKSTLADIVLGVLLPDFGSVTVSGVEPHECVTRWPGAMAYVPQDIAVLSGTVRENVALGIPSEFIDNSLVWEALEWAQLSTFLSESRDGIDTVVGENGIQLSGGQRQRLGIARALYSRPRLLVLDEATSALDAGTERVITETLDSLAGDVTLIVIAHRLATIRHCDQVIHLADGRITGRGTFEEVRLQVPEFDRQSGLLGL